MLYFFPISWIVSRYCKASRTTFVLNPALWFVLFFICISIYTLLSEIFKNRAEIGSQLQASNFQLSILEVDVHGDMAIVRGAYSSSFSVPGTEVPMEDRGKTLQVWKRKADGKWKIHRDMWSSNMPIPGSPQTGEEEN